MSQELVMFEIVVGYSIWHGLILKQQKKWQDNRKSNVYSNTIFS